MKKEQNHLPKPRTPKTDPIPSPRFTINKIAIAASDKRVVAGISEKHFQGSHSIHKSHLPQDVAGLFTGSGGSQAKRFYVGFNHCDDLPHLEIQLSAYPSVMQAWYNHQLTNYFTEKQWILSGNLINDLIVWVHEKDLDDHQSYCFSRTALWIDRGYSPGQLSLGVAFIGFSYILRNHVMELSKSCNFSLEAVNKVICDKKIVHLDSLTPEMQARRDTLYPVLNAELARQMNIQRPFRKNKLRQADAVTRNREFAKKHLFTDEFHSCIPLSTTWLEVPQAAAGRIPRFRHLFRFGNNQCGPDLLKGLLTHGPNKPVAANQLNVFFIYHMSDASLRDTLEASLAGKAGNKGINAYAWMPVYFDKSRDLQFTDKSDPSKEVRLLINTLQLVPGATYLAFYLSPHGKTATNPVDYRAYYLIKEALLQRGIASQTIDRDHLLSAGSSFRYWIPNIAMACIAKTGGVPWVLDREQQDELIVGFGLFDTRKYKMRFVGTSVCFSNSGVFKAFDVFPSGETFMLAASLEKALNQYILSDRKPSRLIVHYYKNISNKLFEPVRRLLDAFNPDIPVIVIHINSSQSERFLISDATTNHHLPLTGSYFNLGSNRYLLYINSLYAENDTVNETPLPVSLEIRCNKPGLLNEKAYVCDLLAQVYDFSSLYWRSLRQPQYPVTLAYPRMLASHASWFDNTTLPDLPLTRVPWFL